MWLSFLLSVTYVSIVLVIARHHLIINLTINKLLVPLSSTPRNANYFRLFHTSLKQKAAVFIQFYTAKSIITKLFLNFPKELKTIKFQHVSRHKM